MPKDREYSIDLGNSNTGQVGAVAYVKAPNKKAALEAFRAAVGYDNNDLPTPGTDDVKVHVYFNPRKVTLKDVSRVE